MTVLAFEKAHRAAALLDQLMAVRPELFVRTNPDGTREAIATLESDGDSLTLTLPEDLDAQALAEIEAIVTAHDPAVIIGAKEQEEADAAALRQQVIALLQSTVGVAVNDLTASQRNALIAGLLWKTGALNASLEIRPLAEWVEG